MSLKKSMGGRVLGLVVVEHGQMGSMGSCTLTMKWDYIIYNYNPYNIFEHKESDH